MSTTRTRSCTIVACATLLLSVTRALPAQVTQYTTLSAFLSAVSNPGTDSFTGFNTTVPTPSPLVRSAGSYSYTASTDGDFFGALVSGNAALSTDNANVAIALSAFSSSVRGVGANVFGSDVSGAYKAGPVRIDWTEIGGSSGSVTIPTPTISSFFGVVSAGAGFSAFVITPATTDILWPTVDNLVLAAPVTPVPEPQSVVLVAVGLLALTTLRRRRVGGPVAGVPFAR